MSSKIFSLLTAFVLSVFLLTSFASAAGLELVRTDTLTEVNTDSDVVVTFDFTHGGGIADPQSGLVWNLTTNIGSWTVSPTLDSILISDGDVSLSATLNIPSDAVGTVTANINVESNTTSTEDLSISLTILDTTAPVITLIGSSVVEVGVGTTYVDDGANVLDNVDGDSIIEGNVEAVNTEVAGTYIVTYDAMDDAFNNATQVTRTVKVFDYFCNEKDPLVNGAINDSELTLDVEITNKGNGDDEEWLPLDTIEIEVTLDNDFNYDLDDVVFELGLFKEGSSKNIAEDMIWISEDDEEIEVGDIDEDEEKTHTFEFRVDPSEVEEGNYIVKVKAYEDKHEDETCIDYSDDLNDFGSSIFSAEIDLITEGDDEKMVVVDTESLPKPIKAFCGEEVEFTADIYNIGDQDFQDQIMVNLYNSALGIDLEKVLKGDLDIGEMAKAYFSFTVPMDAEEMQHTLKMRVYYDYDEDDDEYDEVSEETFNAFLKVADNCILKEDLNATDLDSDNKKSNGLFSKITGSVVGMGNSDGWYLWVIGAVNVILVFSIIFVAVRMLRRA